VRAGEFKGASGKHIMNTVVIGIGGSFLGPYFAVEAMRFEKGCYESA
jgi:glucose-6-phosphate isomerase